MIAHLRGTVLEKHPQQVIVETGGVGYEVNIPVSTFTQLPDPGQETKLRVHTHVREDAIILYGFSTADEKFLFEKLITVSGIGPGVALKALSGIAAADLVAAIRHGDIAQLTRIPGVPAAVGLAKGPALSELEADLVSALTNLGSARPAAEAAVLKAHSLHPDGDFELLFRKALELVR
jgi:holliday junction DNA helicase RuvA